MRSSAHTTSSLNYHLSAQKAPSEPFMRIGASAQARFYTQLCVEQVVSTITTGRIHYTPVIVPQGVHFDHIGVRVVTANGDIRLGLYSSDPDGVPYGLMMESAALTTVAGWTAFVCNRFVPEGLYWFAFQGQSTLASYNCIPAATHQSWIGWVSTGADFPNHYYETQSFGAFPSTATVGLTSIASAPTPALAFQTDNA